MTKISRLAVLAMFLLPLPAMADTFVGAFGDWEVSYSGEGDSRVCYMVSAPKTSEGDYTSRGQAYAIVTHRPAAKLIGVPSFVAGYSYDRNKPIVALVDGNQFALYSSPETPDRAWTENDKALREAMIKGRQLVIKGTSSRGTATTDNYSLSGVTAAYQEIGKHCGVK